MSVIKKITIVAVVVFIAYGVSFWQKTKTNQNKEILVADYRNDCSNFVYPQNPTTSVDTVSGDVSVHYLDMTDNKYKYVLLNYKSDFSKCSADAKKELTNIVEMNKQRP